MVTDKPSEAILKALYSQAVSTCTNNRLLIRISLNSEAFLRGVRP